MRILKKNGKEEYNQLCVKTRNYLIEEALSDKDKLTNIFADTAFNVFFTEDDKKKLKQMLAEQIYKSALVSFSHTSNEERSFAYEAVAEEALGELIEGAINDSTNARQLLQCKDIVSKISAAKLICILSEHTQEDFFYRDLTNGNLTAKSNPLKLSEFALADAEALKLILANEQLKILLKPSELQAAQKKHQSANTLMSNDDKDFYEILELKSGATASEIKGAYHLLSLKYHSDKDPNYSVKYDSIQEAYRSLYDKVLLQEQCAGNEAEEKKSGGFSFRRVATGILVMFPRKPKVEKTQKTTEPQNIVPQAGYTGTGVD